MTAGQSDNTYHATPSRLPITLVYVFFGPLIGLTILATVLLGFAVVDWMLKPLSEALNILGILEFLAGVLMALPIGAFFSYMLGGAQALLTGAILSAIVHYRGRAGYVSAFLAALMVGIVAHAMVMRDTPGIGVSLTAIGIAASLILRFLFRNRFRT